ncbi:MAG: LexA repressor [uncultured bacterium]|nr:MAG: LexA repressor [uncultured bacterium]OGH83587.1 MAG: repressor LexA [Candidatus Magasanikbacteria bacterium RIFOXYC12_FULL_32_21b]OGH91545.1 MAG: repressor LexA [Candidatus Magasanikbacteria bacterium RIFOXYD12_FULL_33_17]
MKLTTKQKEVLSTIQELTEKLGAPPTLREVRDFLSYKNTSSVQRHTDILKKNGYLGFSRSLKIKKNIKKLFNIPVVGSISCGTPLLAEENIEAYVPYEVKGDYRDYFFLRAMGDSMNNSGIDDGDLVLVKKESSPSIGEKIVALIGDDATIKIFNKENKMIVLKPNSNNPIHKPIYIVDLDNFMVQGKVVDVMKI